MAAGVRTYFTEAESYELTVDVMRNAGNKIAVAFAADAPNVASGVERFHIDENGQAVAG